MIWVQYSVSGKGYSDMGFMYDCFPVSDTITAKKMIFAKYPGATEIHLYQSWILDKPPSWWPGEKEKREAKRQEEKRAAEEKRRARQVENQNHPSGEFWGEGKYDNFTDIARDQKDGMYEKIMNCQTNILTAPLKLICWLLHEIFNPNSFFRKHIFSVVNIILVFAGYLAYKNELMMLVILCAVSVVVNCIIGMKTDRSGIALLVVIIEAAIIGVAIWMTQPQKSSFVNLNGIGYVNQERIVTTKSQQIIDENLFKKLSSHQFDESELSGYTKDELRIMRNSIFARYGYIFKSEDLKNFFAKFEWYKPRFADVNNKLNSVEKKNIKVLKSLEDSKR